LAGTQPPLGIPGKDTILSHFQLAWMVSNPLLYYLLYIYIHFKAQLLHQCMLNVVMSPHRAQCLDHMGQLRVRHDAANPCAHFVFPGDGGKEALCNVGFLYYMA